MAASQAVAVLALAGVLAAGSAGCSPGDGEEAAAGASGGGSGGGAGGDKPALKSRIRPPAAFDATAGWEIQARWLAPEQPFPYAVSPKSGRIAYLEKGRDDFTLKVRDAAGELLASARPWKSPQVTEDQIASKPGSFPAVPVITLVSGGAREYFAVWMAGKKAEDELHEARSVVSVAFYPVDASGENVAPSGTADVGVEHDRVYVFPGSAGIVVSHEIGDTHLISPDGKVSVSGETAKVRIGNQAVDPDPAFAYAGRSGLITNAEEQNDPYEGGGFGAAGGWHSTQVAPPGAAPQPPEFGAIGGEATENKHAVDAEALASDPAADRIWVAYEGRNSIVRFGPTLVEGESVSPPAMRRWSSNGGPEALARLPDGRFLVLQEGRPDWSEQRHEALLFPGDPVEGAAPVEFRYAPPAGYRPVDAAPLPDGRVLILHRAVTLGLPYAFAVRIAVADPEEIRAGEVWRGREIGAIAAPLPADNFEGIAAVPRADGSVTVWLISDDNNAALQRTLLYRLRWTP